MGLGHLADVLPRRQVLVSCDGLRAILLALMALPVMPLGGVVALLVVAVAIGAVFSAGESAMVTEVIDGERYAVAAGVRIATLQVSQLVGYAVGGVVVAWLGPRPALLVDAATFVLSTILIRSGVRARPAPAAATTDTPHAGHQMAGLRAIMASSSLKILLGLSWLSGLTAIPEGLAAPYAAVLGGGAASIGLLLAANPAGTLIGSLVFVRAVPDRSRRALVGPLAVAGGLPLIACASHPRLAVTLALWACTGLCAAYHAQIPVEFMQAVPNRGRGQAIAIASSGLYAIQGVGLLLGGVIAARWGTAHTIALAGAGVVLLGALLAILRARHMLISPSVTELP